MKTFKEIQETLSEEGLLSKARRGINKALTWSDISSPGGPQGMMKRIQSYDTKQLKVLLGSGKENTEAGSGSSRSVHIKMIKRELRRRGERGFEKNSAA
jgi:hypothetical protein|tara:strand:+ start:6855 stop:7151 length:297 start_codon:yes stop_codon:yes gene_type:complete